MNIRSMLLGTAAALVPLLASCSSAPTRVFMLEPVASAAAPLGYSGPMVRVDAVHLPPELDRIEILQRSAPGELKIDDLEQWSAPLGQAATQTLSADLASRLPPGSVIFPHLAKPDAALGISVEVLEFQVDQRGGRLQAGWVIASADSKSGGIRGTAVLRTDITGGDAALTARALGALLGQLADRIVLDLQRSCCGEQH